MNRRLYAFTAGALVCMGLPVLSSAQQPDSVRSRMLRTHGSGWDSMKVAGASLYFGSPTSSRGVRERLALLTTRAISRASVALEIRETGTVSILFVHSAAQLYTLTAWKGRGWASGRDSLIVVVANDTLVPPLTHELTHVYTFRAWGRPTEPSSWITEGVASAADGVCGGQSLRAVAAGLQRAGRLPKVRTLMYDFRTLPLGEAYAAAGSLVEFLGADRERGGARRLWSMGADSIPLVFHESFEEIDGRWNGYLRRSASIAPAEVLRRLSGRGCS